MLFEKILKFIYEEPLMNILILLLFIWACVWAYQKSLKSRKYYNCPQCGESFRSEHMHSKHCKVCGAELEETNDTNVNDKAV